MANKKARLFELREGRDFIVSIVEPSGRRKTAIIRTATRTFELEPTPRSLGSAVVWDSRRGLVVARFRGRSKGSELWFSGARPFTMARAGVIATDFLFNSPGGAEAMRYRTLPLGRKDRPGAVAAGRLKVPVDTHAAIALAVLFHEAREIERWESIALAFAGI